MIELLINRKNLNKFLNDIRKSDRDELFYHFGKKLRKKFIQTVKNTKNTYFIGSDSGKPLALGGFHKNNDDDVFLAWLLCTNEAKNNKYELYKYIKAKVDKYKEKCSFMFNYIYKSNYDSLKLLSALGFSIVDLTCEDFKLFYYTKGNSFDTRYITRK